jgi:hypothetical protein
MQKVVINNPEPIGCPKILTIYYRFLKINLFIPNPSLKKILPVDPFITEAKLI